jgi:hypothetical protein
MKKPFSGVFEDSMDDASRGSSGAVDNNSPAKRWSNLKAWLESNEQLYWITGKAGSGKSTLMKFLCFPSDAITIAESPRARLMEDTTSGCEDTRAIRSAATRCEKFLRIWAGDNQLIIASFYFWNSGIRMQMSMNALLRTLLFQILRQCPRMIPSVSPGRWEALYLFNADSLEWSNQELLKILRLVTRTAPLNCKFCIFIDGLDEFEGDHGDLISLLQDLLLHKTVKVCVASRPWLVFEDAFKHKPSLRLEDLTYGDIKAYVTYHFSDNPGFHQLRILEPNYASQLIENIVEKASGVFIWVYLVVSSLLSGMRHGDRLSDLQRRLDMLPPDLERLYEAILKSIDPFYLENTAQLFKFVQASPVPPSSLLLSFADEEHLDFALKWDIGPLSNDQASARHEIVRRRVKTWSMGFLEVSTRNTDRFGYPLGTVQYLHRTVKDYIETEDVQKLFQSVSMTSFDAHLKLCSGNLALLKCSGEGSKEQYWACINQALHLAARVQPSYYRQMISLLDEVDRTANIIKQRSVSQNPYGRYRYGNWPYSHPNKDILENSGFGFSFLSLTVRYGIVAYVEAKVHQKSKCYVVRADGNDYEKGKWPLLWDALLVNAL